jgi:leucyl-tRNA synthetase
VLLLAPYAPHMAEELWARCGHTASLTYAPWPVADESLLVAESVTLAVQVGSERGLSPQPCRQSLGQLVGLGTGGPG